MIKLYCDGGETKVCYQFEGYEPIIISLPSKATNNTAEYLAVTKGLEAAIRLHWKDLLVLSDSQLIVRQLSGEYKVKKKHLANLNARVKSLVRQLDSVEFEWINREKNLAGIALEEDKK